MCSQLPLETQADFSGHTWFFNKLFITLPLNRSKWILHQLFKKKNSIEVGCNVFLGESTFPRKRYTEMFEICRTWISTEPNLTYRYYLDNLLLKPITVYCIWSMWEHNNSVCLIWHNKFATFPTVVLATMKIPKDKHCSD